MSITMLANLAQQFNVPVANVVVGIASLAVLIITLIAATIYALLSARRINCQRFEDVMISIGVNLIEADEICAFSVTAGDVLSR